MVLQHLRPFAPMEVVNTRVCSRASPAPGNAGFDGCLELLSLTCRAHGRALTVWDDASFVHVDRSGERSSLPKRSMLHLSLPALRFLVKNMRGFTVCGGGQEPPREVARAVILSAGWGAKQVGRGFGAKWAFCLAFAPQESTRVGWSGSLLSVRLAPAPKTPLLLYDVYAHGWTAQDQSVGETFYRLHDHQFLRLSHPRPLACLLPLLMHTACCFAHRHLTVRRVPVQVRTPVCGAVEAGVVVRLVRRRHHVEIHLGWAWGEGSASRRVGERKGLAGRHPCVRQQEEEEELQPLKHDEKAQL